MEDTYVRRATRAFSFIWSVFTLVVVSIAILLSVSPVPAPDYFIIAYAVITGVASAVFGFLHGVTLAAARRLDDDCRTEATEQSMDAPHCYSEYCSDDTCQNRHN